MPMAEQFTDAFLGHGESPIWWPTGHLRCIDVYAGDLVDIDEAGRASRTHVGAVATVVRPRALGGAVVAVERGIALLDEAGTVSTMPPVWADTSIRMNDGGCDPDGRFYCGSMGSDAAPGRGTFFRFDAADRSTELLSSVTISNGFCFAGDGRTAYYVDTPTQRIDVFDYVDGELINRRPFVEIAPAGGAPDGLTVDAAGGVWVACWGAGAVRHYDREGRLDEVVAVPGVSQPSAVALGGHHLDQLYITTSREGLGPDDEPSAGALFVLPGVGPGLPVLPARL
jgi:sugar lactone lactonase YvrE